jgi:para-aminobenzoate synthetase/4-amino-4-deoxychorismate lyase
VRWRGADGQTLLRLATRLYPLDPATSPIRARRLPLPGRASPAAVLGVLAEDAHPVALSGAWLSVDPEDRERTLTILGSEPTRLAAPDSDAFALLDDLPVVGANLDETMVGGGWIGWLGYGLGALAEPGVIPPQPPPALSAPPFSLAFYDHLIVHDGHRWWFEMLETAERAGALSARLDLWRRRLSGPLPALAAVQAPELHPVGAGGAGHRAAVAACVERIAAGDLYQANLTLGLTGAWEGEPLALFARALEAGGSRFGAAVGGVVSLSPERYLRRHGSLVWSEPIKGTRRRTGDCAADAAALAELEGSEKDRAEHVMIVDLVRNDLGRVCEYSSVEAEPPRAEPHAGVWQLVSTVTGRLRPQVSNATLLRATFPPGSVTGAPKIAAMQVIAELESTRRQVYTGAVGIASPVAGLDLNVAIRTFELAPGRIWLGVGGAIVADSDLDAELAEALTKAAGPATAVGGRVVIAPVVATTTPARRYRWRSRARSDEPGRARALRTPSELPPRALGFAARPDPAEGVFETLLAENGTSQFGAAHIARLAASVADLYDLKLRDDVAARTGVAGAGMTRARVRVLVRPDGEVQVTATPEPKVPQSPPALTLEPWLLPGGLGGYKWADRRLLAALAEAAPETVPLLVDGDANVLEAAWANVWIVEHGRWLTPPADGRILPGVTRAVMLANPGILTRVESFDLDRLAHADAIYLSSSISGRRQAVLAGGPVRR